MTVTYLKNRDPIKALASHSILYEAWYHHKPNLSNLQLFGCIAYHCNKDLYQKNIGKKSWCLVKCQLLGYKDINQYRL